MSFVGEYNDLDMRGIRSDFYEGKIPRDWQDALRGFGTPLRFIWNPVTGRPTVVAQVESTLTLWHGCHLKGWGIVMHCDQDHFNPTYIAHLIGQKLQLKDFNSEDDLADEIDRRLDADKASRKAARDKELEDFVDDQFPRGCLQQEAIVRDGERFEEKALDDVSPRVLRRKKRGTVRTG